MAKKKKKSRKVARPMKVVSLKAALHMVKQAQRRIAVRGAPRKKKRKNPEYACDANPLRHFPKLKGRGRPAKVRKWTMATRLVNGRVAEKKFTATQAAAYGLARRIAKKRFHGSRVAEVILDDGR